MFCVTIKHSNGISVVNLHCYFYRIWKQLETLLWGSLRRSFQEWLRKGLTLNVDGLDLSKKRNLTGHQHSSLSTS